MVFPITGLGYMEHFSKAMEAAGLTDVGRRRSRNEDAFGIFEDAGLLIVADGMGGHAAGALASRMAIEGISKHLTAHRNALQIPDGERIVVGIGASDTLETGIGDERDLNGNAGGVSNVKQVIQSAVSAANREINDLNRVRHYPNGAGMGSTVVGLCLLADQCHVAIFHIGDSRLYRLRDGILTLLTRDHTAYQLWLDGGCKGSKPTKNIITRALGPSRDIAVEIRLEFLMPNDIFLLCSDGLNGMVDDQTIHRVLGENPKSLETTCRKLVTLANDNGGVDNVTVILARCH